MTRCESSLRAHVARGSAAFPGRRYSTIESMDAALNRRAFAKSCLCLVPRDDMYEKVVSNMQEMKARGGRIVAICTEGDRMIRQIADDVIEVPDNLELVMPIHSDLYNEIHDTMLITVECAAG